MKYERTFSCRLQLGLKIWCVERLLLICSKNYIYVGDGKCDSGLNVDGCWDGGDCCKGTCSCGFGRNILVLRRQFRKNQSTNGDDDDDKDGVCKDTCKKDNNCRNNALTVLSESKFEATFSAKDKAAKLEILGSDGSVTLKFGATVSIQAKEMVNGKFQYLSVGAGLGFLSDFLSIKVDKILLPENLTWPARLPPS